MYVDRIRIENFRTYRHAEIELLHADRTPSSLKQQFGIDVLYPNVNLILGNNGMGKSAFLKAVALNCLGPTVRDSGIFPYRFVRREPGSAEITTEIKRQLNVPGKPITMPSTRSLLKGNFVTHPQDGVPKNKPLISSVRIDRRGDQEVMMFLDRNTSDWNSIFSDEVDAFFFVGYGASRRTETKANVDLAARKQRGSARARRVLGLFEESASLIPLSAWFPAFATQNPGRAKQVTNLLKKITGEGHYSFTGVLEKDEYLFKKEDQLMPFPALSDGYKAFFGWVSDLLYHVCMTASKGKTLVENRGIVLVDEIDLHLHPSWQMEILPNLSRSLPNIQFIVTSHSPLIAGSLQWVNLIALEPGESQSTILARKQVAIHGLDADQVLLSPYFALHSTRTGKRAQRLRELRDRARLGDREAALQIMSELSQGAEESQLAQPLAEPTSEAPLAAPAEAAVAARKRATARPKRKK